MRRSVPVAATWPAGLALLLALLAACGQTGPLYLPEATEPDGAGTAEPGRQDEDAEDAGSTSP